MTELFGTWLVDGQINGEVIRLDEPLSFWGGFDAATGTSSIGRTRNSARH